MPYELNDDKFHEECGVFGIYLNHEFAETTDAARTTFYGLFALQHRGQESAGIAVSSPEGDILLHKGMGLVFDVFNPEVLEKLPGHIAIGHVRYSTTGASIQANAQPLAFRYLKGMLALAHNGNLVNAGPLRRRLQTLGSVFQTTTDTEVIANLLARYSQDELEDSLAKTMIDIKGAFALVLMTEDRLVGVRDPLGLRPLCMGEIEGGYVLASESCALDNVGARFVRDINPGEIVIIDNQGVTSHNFLKAQEKGNCIFEYIYFARPDSTIDGINVSQARRQFGRQLAREAGVDADIVIGVPDSGTAAAIGYAEEAGLPFEQGMIKNRYIGRTFIQPTQAMRDLGVRLKLNPIIPAIKGKRVIMVDDSIVRGTTSRQIVAMLREAGATEVHMVVSSPPTAFPCYYGIDTSRREELIAARMSVEEICRMIGADSLHYLSNEGMLQALAAAGGPEYENIGRCTACFNGVYPIPIRED